MSSLFALYIGKLKARKITLTYLQGVNRIGVSRGGGQGVLIPPFPGPPLFICDPPLPPNPISQTNVM